MPHSISSRVMMHSRLLSIARKKATGSQPLSAVEQSALVAFSDLLVVLGCALRTGAGNEYARWQVSPCTYTVPPGFGFTAYAPGPRVQRRRRDAVGAAAAAHEGTVHGIRRRPWRCGNGKR